ncbi:MAG: hypothetical protein HC902_04615 [Calothrix sp. SM1_5_4]|nr:hypothetical protein [Calothrix sp. SM1_5_4]
MNAVESDSVSPLLEFRNRAERLNHWPSVREADFLRLTIRFDRDLFDHLYFGTPCGGSGIAYAGH